MNDKDCKNHRAHLSWVKNGVSADGYQLNDLQLTYKCSGSCKMRKTFNFSETAIFPTEEKGKIISFDNDGDLDLN